MNPSVPESRPVAGRSCRGGVGLNFALAGLLVLIIAGAILFAPPVRAADEKSVLVLTQGNGRQPSVIEFTSGFQQVLATNFPGTVVVYIENLDLQHFNSPDYRREIAEWLRVKYQGRKLDAIVAENEPTADTAFKIRMALSPQIPLVFLNFDRMDVPTAASQTNMTTILATPDVRGTLEAALRLCPDTRRIAFVSSGDNGYAEFYRRDLKRVEDFATNRFQVIKLIGLTMAETKQYLSTLPPQTIVFYNGIWIDGAGQLFTTRDALEQLSSVSHAPIFSGSDTFIGRGTVGGSCHVYSILGTEAASQVIAAVRAGNASSVPSMQSACNQLIFDWQQMRRFGLNENNLPPGSEVRFRSPTLWETYHRTVILVLAALVVQTGLIAALLLQRRRKQQAEAELFASRQMLRTVIDTIPQRVFWKDRNSIFLGCNKPLAEDCGYSGPNELIGKTDYETVAAPMAERYRTDDREVMETDRAKLNYEEPQKKKDGSTGWLRTNKVPLHDKDGRVIGVLGTYEDVTERKQAAETIAYERQLLRTMIDLLPDGVYIKDLDSRFLMANETLAKRFGKDSPAQVLGLSDKDFFPAEIAAVFRAEEEKVFAGNTVHEKEETVVFPNGQVRTLLTTKVPFRNSQGQICGLVGIGRDITERKQLEDQLRQSQKMEAFGQLAGGVAHDFNNLLTIIEGSVALLQLPELTPAEQAGALAEIDKAAERAANLTRQLLTFSRRQLFRPKPLDLNEVVANTARMLQRLIGEHIGLETHFAPGNTPIMADRNMMEQILINLAVNSRDAMPKGGQLVIETAAITISETDAQAHPRARPGSFIRLSITDTGCGITPEQMKHIFEPFFTTKEVGKGTGLGLATVFGIVEQHHGWIEFKSKLNAGTTFHVCLPRLTEEETALIEATPLTRVRGGNETILLVEDDASVRSLMRNLLERKGYHVIEADNGVSAMKLWKRHHGAIDLLLTDMVMPEGVSGQELAERLLREKPALKVIYSSGYTDDMLGKDSPLRDNPNFLEKPFDSHKLLKQVRDCLDGTTGH
jgi:PAS domain S-box-containing protein